MCPPPCRKILLRPFSCDIEVGSLVHVSIITNKGALTGSHWSFFLIVWSLLHKSSTAFSASALVSTASRIVLYFVSCNNPNSGHYFTRLIDSYGLILEILLRPLFFWVLRGLITKVMVVMTEIPTTGLVNFSSGNLTSLTRRTLRVVACSTWNWKETGRNFPHKWQVQLGDRNVTSRLNKILNSSRLLTRFTSVAF